MACYCELKPLPPVYQKITVENITVVRPPMLKVYYWEAFQILDLNKKLSSNKRDLQHTVVVPIRQINSQPLQIKFWLRNLSEKDLEIKLRRIKNCNCVPQETRVGFNQFRQLYHCPHRRLIHISQELWKFKPHELLAFSMTTYFFLFGEHNLSFELKFSDDRVLMLNFVLEIAGFDPDKCLLTRELIPINIRKFERVTQPIWVRNITMTHLQFSFSNRERCVKIHNPNMTVPRQSVWPLMVEYRPTDYENELELILSFDNMRCKQKIKAYGVLKEEPEQCDMPLSEVECADYLYVIYPNRLDFDMCLKEVRTQMVNVHNFGQKCMQFHWQNYVISDFFAVTFEPCDFRLKPHHSKLCIIKVSTFERRLHFRRIPLVLEVHRILDRATQIAKAELTEIESIDDPKWKEDSYLEHVFLHLNIKADRVDLAEDDEEEPRSCDDLIDVGGGGDMGDEEDEDDSLSKDSLEQRQELIYRLTKKRRLSPNEIIELSMAIDQRVTIFEKLFWKYLSKTDFMRIPADRGIRKPIKTYNMIVNPPAEEPEPFRSDVERNTIMEILSRLLAEAITELSKNWVYIPAQYYERIV